MVIGDVNDFIDGLLSLFVGKIKNPVIESSFFKFAKLVLNPQKRLSIVLISTVLVQLGLMKGEKEMIVLRVKARGF